MSAIKWIKLNVDMFDDEKIKIIQSMPEGDSLLIVWIKLITLAGKTNNGGYVYMSNDIPYTEDMLSIVMGKSLTIIKLALQTFTHLGMIEIDERGIYLVNFEKHQSLDRMQEIREYNRLAQQKHREKIKSQKLSMTGQFCQDIDIDKDIDKDIDIYNIYENQIGTLNPKKYEDFNKLIDKYGIDKVKEAIDKAVSNDKKSYEYVKAILNNGIYKKKEKDSPEWMDKDIKAEDLPDDDLMELEKEFEIFN